MNLTIGRLIAFSMILILLAPHAVFAHCDTEAGPLIPEARAALEAGDPIPVLKWVGPAAEPEIRAAFAQAVAERAQGPEAKEAADQKFLETVVRIHREGEGASYTGLKDEPVAPIVAMADLALAAGSADEMIGKMSAHLEHAVREKFDRALETSRHKDESIEAGRAYVAAYVTYMHYVEAVHEALMAAGGHGHGEAAETDEGHAEPAEPAESGDHGH